MSGQMIIRIDPSSKEKIDRLAKAEGKSTSQVVRELIEEYIQQRDMSAYIDDLWNRLGSQVRKKGARTGDIQSAIRAVRSEKR